MIILCFFSIVFYSYIFIYSIKNISFGNFKYLFFYICLGLPFYTTLQAQVFDFFENKYLINIIRFSKDFIFFYAILIFTIGSKEKFFKRKFYFSFLDKLILFLSVIIIIYTVIPFGEAVFFSKVIYAKNLLIISITYLIGRNVEINYKFYNLIKKIILFLVISSFSLVLFEHIFSIHFHSLINFSEYNSIINEIDPQGNYDLSWSFEAQSAKPRYASFFANPLEFSASLLFFISFIFYYLYNDKKKYLLFLLLIIPSLYLAFSRGAIVAAFLILFFTFYLNKRYKFIMITLISFIPISLLIFYFSGEEIQYLIIDTLRFENTSSLGHLIEWIEGILSIIENPFGVGLAMSGNAGGVDQSIKIGGENQFLIFGVQMGILTMILYMLILFKIISNGINMYRISKNNTIKHISFIVSCTKFGLLIPLFTANAEIYLFVSLASWFLAGYVEKKLIQSTVNEVI